MPGSNDKFITHTISKTRANICMAAILLLCIPQKCCLKKSSIFFQGLPQHNIAGPRSKLHSLFASLRDCRIVIIGIRRLYSNIWVFSNGMMFLVLIKTGQVFQKLKLGDRYDDLKRLTFSFLGRQVGQIW